MMYATQQVAMITSTLQSPILTSGGTEADNKARLPAKIISVVNKKMINDRPDI